MINLLRPYLVIPKLIQQKTWGGEYISSKKGIQLDSNNSLKLGQSYELFSGSKLTLMNEGKQYEVGHPDRDEIDKELSIPIVEGISLFELSEINPEMALGTNVTKNGNAMPLLLKLTQAKGNSFQLHIKPGTSDPRWLSKSETWYFFEKGKVTYGISRGISVKDYKDACVLIDREMKEISQLIVGQKLSVDEARIRANELTKKINPWQFVQRRTAEVGQIFDLSQGGIHHSWEEDSLNSNGNILYEVQKDRMDPFSTIRAFDQGKIDDKGNIREVNIDDYFKYLDTSDELNMGSFSGKSDGLNNAFTTKDYAMDIIEFEKNVSDSTDASFCHYFVKNGRIKVETDEGWVTVERGWSCFVPAAAANEVKIESLDDRATILKTYVPTKN
ncbi:hypothetical protein HYV64_03720 [Candidatus Shapirobacteria bacterium]|nr:hypothetical protein [Candidatus Shapirobacteria bacterium]